MRISHGLLLIPVYSYSLLGIEGAVSLNKIRLIIVGDQYDLKRDKALTQHSSLFRDGLEENFLQINLR